MIISVTSQKVWVLGSQLVKCEVFEKITKFA